MIPAAIVFEPERRATAIVHPHAAIVITPVPPDHTLRAALLIDVAHRVPTKICGAFVTVAVIRSTADTLLGVAGVIVPIAGMRRGCKCKATGCGCRDDIRQRGPQP